MKNLRRYADTKNLSKDVYSQLDKISKKISNRLICDVYGSCVHFAELFVESVNQINPDLFDYFDVIEGYVTTTNGRYEHTWIELHNGEKIDPTFEQFKYTTVIRIRKHKKYSGLEYLQFENSWFRERRLKYPEYIFKTVKKNLWT